MTEARSATDVSVIYQNAKKQNLPIFILGGGSNVIATDTNFPGIVILNRIPGFEVINEDLTSVTIKVGAGENWDDTVLRTVKMNLSGIEAMSAIPGTVGAAPVQNIGAYGQEVGDALISVEVYDSSDDNFKTLTNSECNLTYRSSIFRTTQAGRYVITSVTLRLYKSPPTPPFYAALQEYFDARNITIFTPQTVRDAVIAIRSEKLPDPSIKPNAGSFFKNAIIDKWQYDELKQQYPKMPGYDMGGKQYKIPTGWLIEQLGFKGELIRGIRVNDKNALVLINESASSYSDLAAARSKIAGAVRDKFHIAIEQEPLEIR